jgi:hypothetical protein
MCLRRKICCLGLATVTEHNQVTKFLFVTGGFFLLESEFVFYAVHISCAL